MPKVIMTLPETSQSVARPVIFEVISQVKKITGIPEDTQIYFPGESAKMQQIGTALGDTSRDPTLGNNEFLFIEVEDTYNENSIATTAVVRPEHAPVFMDKALGVFIAPVYSGSDIVINFKYRTISETAAKRWCDDIRVRVSNMRDVNIHSVTYHYPLPEPYVELIETIYAMRENVAGYGDTIFEYVMTHTDGRLKLISDLDGKAMSFAVAERQSRIVGRFGFDGAPEKPEKDNGNGAWTISFSYKFTYEKPVACNMTYPVIVHNQLLPPKYVIMESTQQEVDGHQLGYSNSIGALHSFEQGRMNPAGVRSDFVARLPAHDEFQNLSHNLLPKTGTIFSLLCEIDLKDRKSLFNLKDLGDLYIDPDVLNFMLVSEAPYMTRQFKSLFQLMLFNDQQLAGNEMLICDSKGNVSGRDYLSLRTVNRVCLSLILDLTSVDRAAIKRIELYPKAKEKVTVAINELLKNSGGNYYNGPKTHISDRDYKDQYRNIINTNPKRNIPRNTAGGYTISNSGAATLIYDSYGPGNGSSADRLGDIRGSLSDSIQNDITRMNTVQISQIGLIGFK